MMRIEHVNLVVPEIDPTLDFLKAAFPDWRVRGFGADEWNGRPRKWVHFGTDEIYITLNDGGEGNNRKLSGWNVGLAHIGIEVADAEGLIARMAAAGYEPTVVKNPDGPFRKRIYFVEPAGFEFEFVEYMSDVSSERNEYSAPEPFVAEAAS